MAAATKTTLTAELAATLRCKNPASIPIRLAFLGHAETCGRCGGSGHYSYNPRHGTTCYGCSGVGQVAPRLTRKLIEVVKADVAAGRLAPYLERLAAKTAARKLAAGVDAMIEASRTTAAYHAWYDSTRMADRAENRPTPLLTAIQAMHALGAEARALGTLLTDGRWDKKVRGYVKISDADSEAAATRLVAIVAEIKALDASLDA